MAFKTVNDHMRFDPVLNRIVTDKAIQTTLSSFWLGEYYQIAGGGSSVFFRNSVQEKALQPVWSTIRDQSVPANQDASGIIPARFHIYDDNMSTGNLGGFTESNPLTYIPYILIDPGVGTALISFFGLQVRVQNTIPIGTEIALNIKIDDVNGIVIYDSHITVTAEVLAGDLLDIFVDIPLESDGTAGFATYTTLNIVTEVLGEEVETPLMVSATEEFPAVPYSVSHYRFFTFHDVAGVAGADTQLQYNNNGIMGGISGITSDGANLLISSRIQGDGNGGSLDITGADSATVAGGDVFVTGGNAGTVGGGGGLIFKSGDAIGSGEDSGPITIDAGTSTDGNIGDILLARAFGKVGIGVSFVESSAVLEIKSTTHGFLLPRMTTAQRDLITSPVAGLEIFNLTNNKPQFYNGSVWGGTAGNETLAEILIAGNTSSGKDLIVSNGDTLRAQTAIITGTLSIGANTTPSPDIVIQHAGTEGFIINKTGDLTIDNYDTAADTIVRLGNTNNTTSFRVRNSSDDNLFSVDAVGATFIKDILTLGTGNIVSPDGSSGVNINITSGSGSAGNGGGLTLESGGGAGAGGTLNITAGDGTFAGGPINITTGSVAGTGVAGTLTLLGGQSGGSSVGGPIHIFGGIGGDANGNGGIILIHSGSGGSGQGDGAILSLEGGQGYAGGNTDGGDVDIQGGQNFGSGKHGNVLIQKDEGSVGIGVSIIDSSALLEMDSNTQGFLQTRMTTAQKIAIVSANTGLSVYDVSAKSPSYYDGTQWVGYDSSIVTVYVRSLADLPAPVTAVITLADSLIYKFLNAVDLAGNQLKMGANTALLGINSAVPTLSGTTSVPLIVTNGVDGFSVNNLGIAQNGSGDLMDISMTALQAVVSINDATLSGGIVRLITGFGFLASDTVFSNAQIIQDGTGGGVDSINISGASAMIDGAAIDGCFLFENLSTTASFIFNSGAILLTSASVGIRIQETASIDSFIVKDQVFQAIHSGSIIMVVENPDDIEQGTLSENSFVGAGLLLASDPIALSNYVAPSTTTNGIGFDGTNIILADTSSDQIHLMNGKNSSIQTTIAGPGTNPFGVVWARGDLVSSDPITNLIYHHSGFTTTLKTTFAAPAANIGGLTYDGTNLISIDPVTNLIYVHDGITATILKTFASPASGYSGIAYDGINLLVSDSGTVYVMRGISATVQYIFSAPGSNAEDLVITDDGAAILQSIGNLVHLYNHPITFDHSSATWLLQNNTGAVAESSDHGGSTFESINPLAGPVLTPVMNVWMDIHDSGGIINYGTSQGMEKCRLFDEHTGEVIWTGVRDRGRILSAVATYSRDGGTTNTAFELAIVINGEIQRDSVTRSVLNIAAEFITHHTIAITRCLIKGDKVKIMIRNVTNTNQPEFIQSKVSIN